MIGRAIVGAAALAATAAGAQAPAERGQPISPQLPFPFHRMPTARDLDALVALIRAIPPLE